jgi:cobalt-precorrin-5B (C1)-methyltransferase
MSGTELKWGLSTGVCACAASVAAAQALIMGVFADSIEVRLPSGRLCAVPVYGVKAANGRGFAYAVKDGGSDPDATHGAKICSTVGLSGQFAGVSFAQGEGVGQVTLSGLELPIGQPAVNPAPRLMIKNHLAGLLSQLADSTSFSGIEVEISVPGGKEIAQKTLNPRLGITGGISILGTTGLVKPYSSAAFIASIEASVSVAAANGAAELVLSSGGRSETALMGHFAHIPEYCFIQYGNWIGSALDICHKHKIHSVYLCPMIGKACKLAAGMLDTHSRESVFDAIFIAGLAKKAGYPKSFADVTAKLRLARMLEELLPIAQTEPLYSAIAQNCIQTCAASGYKGIIKIALVSATGSVCIFEH